MFTWLDYVFFGYLIMVSLGLRAMTWQAFQLDKFTLSRCQAAQQTILDEAELIAAGGKFPGEHVTDRWNKLLGGCQ